MKKEDIERKLLELPIGAWYSVYILLDRIRQRKFLEQLLENYEKQNN